MSSRFDHRTWKLFILIKLAVRRSLGLSQAFAWALPVDGAQVEMVTLSELSIKPADRLQRCVVEP